jgi:hypothetical protein
MLFGREEALATAVGALEAAAAGRGGALVVTGEAGIGKSALARALTVEAEARGAQVGVGRAWEVGGAPAYWPWSQALGELGLELDELLGNASGEMASAQRLVAFDRVVRAVHGLDALVVIILDDLHAADVASLELALALARAARRRRLLLVVTTRESELLERPDLGELVGKLTREGASVSLQRLDPAATATWLAKVDFTGDPAEVHRLSEGNPLFIEEAVRLGVDRFAKAAAGGVAVVLAEHLARISRATRETLAAAAVLGRECALADVAGLTGAPVDDVDRAGREATLAGVLAPARATSPASLAFAHVLLRDALYDALPPSRRAELHARAADVIEARGAPPALVATHLLEAGDSVDAGRITTSLCRAADAALARHAADAALELLTRGRERLGKRLDEAMSLVLDLTVADAKMRGAPSDEARALCVDCAARAKRLGLAREQARAALTYGREVLTGRVDPRMIALLEDALAVVPAEETLLRAKLLSRLASALMPPLSDEALARGTAHSHEALSLARSANDVPTLLHTLLWTSRAFGYVIPLSARVEHLAELVSLARLHGEELPLVEVAGFYAMSLIESGRPVAGRSEAEAYVRLVESLPLPAVQWRATTMRATLAAFDGRLEEAQLHAAEMRRSAGASAAADRTWAFFQIALALAYRERARFEEVAADVLALLAHAPPLGPFAACAHALVGRREEARVLLQAVVDLPRGLPGILISAITVVLLESAELAEVFYEALLGEAPNGSFFYGPAASFPYGPVSLVLGQLSLLRGDEERARMHLDAAIEECREMQTPPFLALAEAARARVGQPRGAPPTPPAAPSEKGVTLTREGDVWAVHAGTSPPFRVKHAKGLEYLQQLLATPGREIYVLMLGGAGEGAEDAGAVLDERAKASYRERVADLEDQLHEAERLGDRGRATRAREELEAIGEQLAAAVGLGGRDRKAASNVERARVNVQRRIKEGIRRIAENDAALGRYLEATVHTGRYCVYKPV